MSGPQRLLATCAFVMFSAVATLAQMTTQGQDVPLNSGREFRQLAPGQQRGLEAGASSGSTWMLQSN